ncbi:MAG TPA: hypothetical protein VGH90_04290, partial [Chthoniobacteraceae bacterium]
MRYRTLQFGFHLIFCGALLPAFPISACATEPTSGEARAAAKTAASTDAEKSAAAKRGYTLVRTKPYLPAEFPKAAFDDIWRTWPAELQAKAKNATPAERRKMALSRYGLILAPDAENAASEIPMAYVSDGEGGWALTCLSCHGGKVEGRPIAGLGNSHFAFKTLTNEIIRAWMLGGGKPQPWQISRLTAPLGMSNGTTDAQVFSVQLTALRDDDLNVNMKNSIPIYEHHDLDAPPFWNVRKKKRLYIDGFAEKTPRTIMQFVLYPNNTGETVKAWESDFRDVLAWIESVEPPKYAGEIDRALAARGQQAYNRVCADCHGENGPNGKYPEKRIPIDVIGTDSLRLTGMPVEHRRRFGVGWFGEGGKRTTIEQPDGYVAPPLDGVWASAPYFHNGSVPTLWHVLHPGKRPAVWLRTEDGYDHQRVGLEVATFDSLPKGVTNDVERRRYFDTRLPGKSAAGHEFPDQLTEDEKQAVL